MIELDDHELLAEYASTKSETAFGVLVARYVNLVYSAALRFTGNPHHAEEITQAVFIILAHKAGRLRRGTVLSGWLYHTARLTAANFVKGEIRRQFREQEAYMQSTLTETDADAWKQIAPLLDEAMGRLGETDRNAVVLRYFENKSAQEIATALKLNEAAAHKRVTRGLEKLRKYFVKRGVTLSATVIAGTVAANSVQAAPIGLAMTTAAAAAKGMTIGGSTLILVKGALKIMAWAKVKTTVVIGLAILAVGTTSAIVVEKITTQANSVLEQRLEDGSLLILNRFSFGDKHEFGYGGKRKNWSNPGHDTLAVEFSLVSSDAAKHPLVNPAFYRQFRCVIHGDQGIEYSQEFMLGSFHQDSGGCYGYVLTGSFPRDSQWLWFRIEKSATNNPYGPWQTVAEFKVLNPTHPVNLKWLASPSPTTNTVNGMDFVLGQITVETKSFSTRDIWNHVVTIPTEVWSNGVLLTNWTPTYIQAGDASGNESYFQSHRSLDPRYVWKLDMDFEPESDFSPEDTVTLQLSEPTFTITTNVSDVPVVISWDGNYIEASISTNNSSLALKFVNVANDGGDNFTDGTGSWGQYQFRKGNFMIRKANHVTDAKPTKLTFAIVPNVHTTFYTQPKLVTEDMK